ncbi:MAG: response regulator [Treponema sp.]|jgi:signal transduction histidine kinase/CheY-like chemotaxis protein/HAMP domain-containing protein|nr:response regulator [Treponema sp.]
MKNRQRIAHPFRRFTSSAGMNMRNRLILIFVVIMAIPSALLTVIAVVQLQQLGKELHNRAGGLQTEANTALIRMGDSAVEDSIKALNDTAIVQLERTTTDIAKQIADFLYTRDADILYAAEIEPNEAAYRRFIQHKTRPLVKQREWILARDGKSWVPVIPADRGALSLSTNSENASGYQNRPVNIWEMEDRPLYVEMTYIDLAGNEIVKITNSDQMDSRKKNVSNRLNTYVKAETYFQELKNLKPGEIYVSDVTGAYVRSRYIGMYTPENTASSGLEYRPEEEAYAGMENPLGKRFRGIIRWAAPVVRDGRIRGYVTLALDHDHIMEFVDRITPMDEHYVEMPSAYDGNYAFIWDYQCRSIAHPRHHSIVGFNPQTGEPEVPWLEARIYSEWQASGLSYTEFIKSVPVFHEQSRGKRPAPELTAAGLVGLDGRYLNNAPQCTGWFDLTKEGGSGSFLILWSGIWKPTTAAAIPYYTGNYGKTKRGFGFVTIGAGLEDFQRPARDTEKVLAEIITQADINLNRAIVETDELITSSVFSNIWRLGVFASVMVVIVVFIAIWLASIFSASITNLVKGISRFRAGNRHFRFHTPVKDEVGILADSFDEMADSLIETERGMIVIINSDLNVVYVNDIGQVAIGKSLEDMLGRPYSEVSIYPPDSEFDPIRALHESRETEVLYHSELGCYFKGEASYMNDRDGYRIGYIITSTDVTDMMEQQQRLEQAMTEAKLANQHKGSFLARMSHEIRTPMNAIIGMTGIVKKKLGSGNYNLEDIRENIGQIETSSNHLLGLLNDILDISKIEAGKIELFIEDVDLLKLANTVVAIIQPRCDEKHITFQTRFDLPSGMAWQLDALRLRQVLINLLGNAVKFTPEYGKITFCVIRREGSGGKAWIDFSVSDTGIGISKDAIATLFDPFTQANNQIAQKYGGTGLGLGISRSIVQMFGSNIDVKSVQGEGSEFSFSLLLTENKVEKSEEIQIDHIEGRLKGKRALLVDDVAINRMIAMSMLESTGIDIDEADDGTVALKIFEESSENTYDIIYMDVQMPEMNGYEATGAIRALARHDAKTVPIVALTANAFKEDIDRAIASGMTSHLTKPMDMEKTMEVTFKLLGLGAAQPVGLLKILMKKRTGMDVIEEV